MPIDIEPSNRESSGLAALGARRLLQRRAKRRTSLYIPGVTIRQVRRLAGELDMPVTELTELLIQVAATANFLRLEKQEAVNTFLSDVRLHRAMKLLGGHQPRIHNMSGEPVSMRFSHRFLEIVSLYSRLVARSRSDVMIQFLEQGLRIYGRSWIAVTKALTSALQLPKAR